ncbi:response regulator [Desulfovibrio sp. OttesenSCG-928-A18]|nr:response regulator [Desulfovibrio sp. OttesenSCG-928-A18]
MHILFAEDQETSRFFLASHLRAMGHTVTEAANGQEALNCLTVNLFAPDSEEFGMLITDWDMPIMNGVELAKRARALREAQYLYIILLTGKGDFTDRLHGFSEGGVDDYVVKPFEIDELKLRIQVGIRVIQAERSLREYTQGLERVVRQQTEEIRGTQSEIISRLFNALLSRHAETGSHVRRIGIMSAFLAEKLNWPTAQVDLIRAAAPLHDVGKIGISDAILLKPGPLTGDERLIIQQHSSIGGKILSNSKSSIIRMAERIAVWHHENWDGSGYPHKLKGTKIPMEARIVGLVDVYDALRSDRVYRRGLEEDAVLNLLERARGRKFDPELLDLFLTYLPRIQSLRHMSDDMDLSTVKLDDDDSESGPNKP